MKEFEHFYQREHSCRYYACRIKRFLISLTLRRDTTVTITLPFEINPKTCKDVKRHLLQTRLAKN